MINNINFGTVAISAQAIQNRTSSLFSKMGGFLSKDPTHASSFFRSDNFRENFMKKNRTADELQEKTEKMSKKWIEIIGFIQKNQNLPEDNRESVFSTVPGKDDTWWFAKPDKVYRGWINARDIADIITSDEIIGTFLFQILTEMKVCVFSQGTYVRYTIDPEDYKLIANYPDWFWIRANEASYVACILACSKEKHPKSVTPAVHIALQCAFYILFKKNPEWWNLLISLNKPVEPERLSWSPRATKVLVSAELLPAIRGLESQRVWNKIQWNEFLKNQEKLRQHEYEQAREEKVDSGSICEQFPEM